MRSLSTPLSVCDAVRSPIEWKILFRFEEIEFEARRVIDRDYRRVTERTFSSQECEIQISLIESRKAKAARKKNSRAIFSA